MVRGMELEERKWAVERCIESHSALGWLPPLPSPPLPPRSSPFPWAIIKLLDVFQGEGEKVITNKALQEAREDEREGEVAINPKTPHSATPIQKLSFSNSHMHDNQRARKKSEYK